MGWNVEHTDEFAAWWDTLTEQQQFDRSARILTLEEEGPYLKRPIVGTINGARYPNMKEIIGNSDGQQLRVLFMFDPRTTAILLIGGDKTGRWQAWYPPMQRPYPSLKKCMSTTSRSLKRKDCSERPLQEADHAT